MKRADAGYGHGFGNVLPQIVSVGRSVFDPIWAMREHADPHTEIIHVLSGRVKVRTKDYTISGAEGDTIYTPAHMPHRDDFEFISPLEVFLVHFVWPEESSLLTRFGPETLSKGTAAMRQELSQEFHRLYRDFTCGSAYSTELARVRLLQIIMTLCRQAASKATPGANEARDDYSHARRRQIMSQARQYIQQHYSEVISLDMIAASLDISSYYLSRVFSEESGFTLCSYITQVRMDKAAELLKNNRLNISQVAHHTGFKDSHYFSRIFRSYYSVTPKEYRVKHYGGK